MRINSVYRCAGLILLSAWVSGCATTPDGEGDAKTPQQTAEQIANSRFRATWWNHYDRAVAYQVLGDWESAEEDLRSVVSKRSRDQRWARTYGLHFKAEYFPKRELGFVLYKQERYEDALELLEQSQAEQPTARASYYIDECRSVLVTSSGADTESPTIGLLSPNLDDPVASLVLAGQVEVSDDTFVRRVWIDGEPVRTLGVSSAGSVAVDFAKPATPGSNRIAIRAEDIVGNVTEVEFEFDADLDGPAVSFDEPIRIPGVVSGVASDASGVRAFTVAGRPATIEPASAGTVRFRADVGAADGADGITFRAEDGRGNATEDLLPVEGASRAKAWAGTRLASSDTNAGMFQLAVETAAGTPEILYANLTNGMEIFNDELVVKLVIEGEAPITQLALNDQPFEGLVANRAVQRVTRRISLAMGENALPVHAVDSQGRENNGVITIVRSPQEIETRAYKLGIAHLGSYWDDIGGEIVSPALFSDVFDTALGERPEFDERFEKVNRENIDALLDEQLLSSVASSSEEKLRLGQLTPADLMLVTKIHVVDGHLEAVMQAIDTETGVYEIIDAYGLVADGSIEDSVHRIAVDLAFHLAQRFPRVEAGVMAELQPGQEFLSGLTTSEGVRSGMKCFVVKYQVFSTDGADPYVITTPIGAGRTVDVQTSGARVRLNETANLEGASPNDLRVITK